MNRLTSLLIVLILALVAVTPAFAGPPDREIVEYVNIYVAIDCGEFGVGDFVILDREEGTQRIDTFYDQDGNWIMEKQHISGTDHLYVDGYDKVVEGDFVVNLVFKDLGDGSVSTHWTGNWLHINLPGYGNIAHNAGMEDWVFNPETGEWNLIKEAGLRSVDSVFLCEYLAPPP
jgi:hypothetical protein